MKYSEFKESVKEIGLKPIDVGDYIDVKDEDSRLLRVSKNYKFLVDTDYGKFTILSGHDKESLFNLAIELASTPLDEREDEKKYRLRIPFMNDTGYLNIVEAEGIYYLSTKTGTSHFRTIFTESEIEELKAKHNLDSFVMEEVKEDE